jgi:lysophospholipase L1-like esterase
MFAVRAGETPHGNRTRLTGPLRLFCLTRSPGPKPEVEAPDATVLCFGDSITWGYNAADGSRFPWEARWPGVLASTLGNGFRVVEEGLSGRTTMSDPPFLDGRSAKAVYPIVLETHSPVDAVLILLGTNDLQPVLRLTVEEIGWGCAGPLRTTALSRFGPGGALRERS